MAVRRISTDPALVEVYKVLDSFALCPLLDGNLLEDVRLSAGTTLRLPHKLGRKLRGWLVVRTTEVPTVSAIYDAQAGKPDTDKFLYLRTDGYSPTLSLWVF